MPHLLLDISAHGFGHLSQAAPVVDALLRRRPELRLTVRSGLATERLQQRIRSRFSHIQSASDFGFVMHNAVDIDYEASARDYRAFHANWAQRVSAEASVLQDLKVDAVLANAAYLPLAAAARAGIPCAGFCSLNWADLFANSYGHEPWAAGIHAEILAAYNAADVFLRVSPGMPMSSFNHLRQIGPIARVMPADPKRRETVATRLDLPMDARWVLMGMGGMAFRQPVDAWPINANLFWLVPDEWGVVREDVRSIDAAGLDFTALLSVVDAVLTKPGYGTFVEAACSATPLVYVGRDDWPEEAYLASWLMQHGRAARVNREQLSAGELLPALEQVWSAPVPPAPTPDGIAEAAAILADLMP